LNQKSEEKRVGWRLIDFKNRDATMFIHRHRQPSIFQRFVRFTVVITATVIVVFLIYFHSSIDAFSFGCRPLPNTQLLDHQVSKVLSSYTVIHARKPLSPFSRLQATGGSDNNDDDDTILNRDPFDTADSTGNEGENDSRSYSPFFAEREDLFQMADEVYSVVEQKPLQQWVDGIESDSDSSFPFFAERGGQFEMIDEDMKKVETQKTSGKSFGDRLPFIPARRIPVKAQSPSDVTGASWNSNPEQPIPLLKRSKNEELKDLEDLSRALRDETPEVLDITAKAILEAIALIKSLTSEVDESVQNTEKILKDLRDISSEANESVREETVLKTEETAKDIQDIPEMKQSFDDPGQSISTKQYFVEEVKGFQDISSEANDSFREETVLKTEETAKDVQDIIPEMKQSSDDSIQSISTKQYFVEEVKGFQDISSEANDSFREESVLKTEETVKDVQDIIPEMKQSFDDSIQSIISANQYFVEEVKGFQDISGKENESVLEMEQSVEETVLKTEETVKNFQDIPEFKQSLEYSNSSFSNKQYYFVEEVNDLQEMPKKENESVRETEQSVEQTVLKTEEIVKDVQPFDASNQSIFKQQDLVEKAPSSVTDRTFPLISKDEALDLAAKALIATVQLSLIIGKEVGLLAWRGSKSVYKNTIGPAVEEAWNDQVDNLSSSVKAVEEALNEQVDNLNSSVETAAIFVKNTPTRVMSAVTSSTQRSLASLSSSASAENKAPDIQQDSAPLSDSAGSKTQPRNIQEGLTSVRASANVGDQPSGVQQAPDSVLRSGSAEKEPIFIQPGLASVSGGASAESQQSDRQQGPAPVLGSARAKNQPAFVSKKEAKEDRKNENKSNINKSGVKPVVKVAVKSLEELKKEIEDAQKLAKELSDAMDVAEQAFKMIPDIELEEPMIDVDNLKAIDRIEATVPAPSLPSTIEENAILEEERNKREAEVKDVLARFKSSSTENDLDTELEEVRSFSPFTLGEKATLVKKRNTRNAGANSALGFFKTAKTQVELDAELEEVQSLAKEVADALEVAELALMAASSTSNSSDYNVDQVTERKSP
jgi:hypothetical protein